MLHDLKNIIEYIVEIFCFKMCSLFSLWVFLKKKTYSLLNDSFTQNSCIIRFGLWISNDCWSKHFCQIGNWHLNGITCSNSEIEMLRLSTVVLNLNVPRATEKNSTWITFANAIQERPTYLDLPLATDWFRFANYSKCDHSSNHHQNRRLHLKTRSICRLEWAVRINLSRKF